MGKIHVIDRDGDKHELDIDNGLSLMEPLRDLDGAGIEGLCGGMCSCATCHVFVAPTWFAKLQARQDDELELLEGTETFEDGTSRLSCQIVMRDELDGIEVTLAPEE